MLPHEYTGLSPLFHKVAVSAYPLGQRYILEPLTSVKNE